MPTGEFGQKPWDMMVGAFGLLKPGITRTAAEAELTAIQAQILSQVPEDARMMRQLTPDVLDLQSNFTWLAGRNLRKGLWMLLAASNPHTSAGVDECWRAGVEPLSRSCPRDGNSRGHRRNPAPAHRTGVG